MVESGTGCELVNPHISLSAHQVLGTFEVLRLEQTRPTRSALEGLRAWEGKNRVLQAITEGLKQGSSESIREGARLV